MAKIEPLEPLSEFKEDEAIDKIIEYMMRIYLRRGDPILKYKPDVLRLELRKRIKKVLPQIKDTRNHLLQTIAGRLTGNLQGPDPEGRFMFGWKEGGTTYQVRKQKDGKETMVTDIEDDIGIE